MTIIYKNKIILVTRKLFKYTSQINKIIKNRK